MPSRSKGVLALVGPTAAGKSSLALDIAPALDAEIVSIDSAMVYRGMDIGTDKPSAAELARVPHHLVDVVDPGHTLSVAEFQKMGRRAVEDIVARGKRPLLVGGSGLYFRAIVDPLEFPPTCPDVRSRLESQAAEEGALALHDRLAGADPEAAAAIDPANVRRIVRALEVIEITGRRFSSLRRAWDDYRSIYHLVVAGLTFAGSELGRRIDSRVESMIVRGLIEEVRRLEWAGFRGSLSATQVLGYAQFLAHLEGRISLEEAVADTKARTRRLARRQLTWFRADPRVVWFEGNPSGAGELLMRGAAMRPASGAR
ncbi:MAG: tRNA (adenosine(37)-N6)-dimethylallyltransferase MiaA [Actinomycetota bacterium]